MFEDTQFSWQLWQKGAYPTLEPHSQIKLKVIADYVTSYLDILCGHTFGSETFKITIVDGFAGGGRYRYGEQGSPFVLMEAVRLAETHINAQGRRMPIKIDAHFYFIEEDRFAFECLKHEIEQSPYKPELNRTIFVRQGKFTQHCTEIVYNTRQRHKRGGGRVIFFLDQCGYSAVDPNHLRRLSGYLNHKAEFIINFAIDWFNDFLNDSAQFRAIFEGMKLSEHLDFESLIRFKREQPVGYPFLVEAKLAPAFWKASGSPFFSPFYIQPEGRHRGYWLLHLAPHARARSAMADVHWRNANGSRHYGGRGLGMLAFKPDGNATDFLTGMSFSEDVRGKSKVALMQDLAKKIRADYSDGVTFWDLVHAVCNDTMANISLVGEAVSELASEQEVVITGPEGGVKRTRDVAAKDIIKASTQLVLPLS